MTRIITLSSLLLLTFSLFSQHSIVTIFSDEGEKFYLYVDGEQINDLAKSRVSDVRYSQEYSNLRIEFEESNIPSIKKNFALKDIDGNYQKSVLVIKQNNKGQYKLRVNSFAVYENELVVAEQSANYEVVDEESAEVVANFSISVSDENTNTKGTNGVNMNVSTSSTTTTTNENVSMSMNVSGVSATSSSTSIHTETSYSESSSSGGSVQAAPKKASRCDYATSSADFSKIKNNISANNFEDTKLTVAKDIIKSKCLTAMQIHDVMKLFNFEDNRLELAKYAYNYVFDKDNYYEVYKAFQFNSSIDMLKESIE